MDFKNFILYRRIFQSPFILSLIIFLGVMGPGIITANVCNDAGGITTFSLAGSQFGYNILWLFIPMFIILALIQEMGVRLGVVSKKGLIDLIRERVGIRITLMLVIVLVLCNFGNVLAEFSGIAVSAGIFNVPTLIGLPVAALSIWFLVVKGNYKSVEKVFLVGSAIYITYIASAFLAGPNWGLAAKSLVIPHLSANTAYLTMIIGVIGATIAPWQMFYLQAAIVEKEVTLKNLKYSKLDAIGGALSVNVIGFFIVLACAATIFIHNIPVNSVVDISKALVPLAGNYASILFAFGFLNASILSASIVPLSTAYLVCESLGLEAGVNKGFREAPVFHGLYLGLILLAVIIILIPNAPLLSILYFSQVFNGMIIPFCLIFMLLIINDKKIMGEYVNSKLYNYIAGATVVIVIALTIYLVLTNIFLH